MNKKTFILAALFATILTACSEPVPQEQWSYNRTPLKDVKGLEECAMIQLKTTTSGGWYTVIRCPNSSTTTSYRDGKVDVHHTVTENGVQKITSEDQKKKDEQIAILKKQVEEQDMLIQKQKESLLTAIKMIEEKK